MADILKYFICVLKYTYSEEQLNFFSINTDSTQFRFAENRPWYRVSNEDIN